MQAGFAMVETGFTRAKNAGNILMKNLMDFCIGTIVFILIGFGLLLGEDLLGLIGKPGFDIFTAYENFDWSNFVFNLVFCATAATIVSGAMAERTRFLSYCIYSAVISALIYPIEAHWVWGGGWLAQIGFHDFAGSACIHMVGGLCAFIGAWMLGPRIGKFVKNKEGKVVKVNAFPGHNLPIGALVSGFVMGGLIPLASYQALTGALDLRALLWAVPTILGVGLIMFTNNTCDVEKDVESGRRTLSVLLGRERARKLYHGVVYAWAAAIVVLVAVFFTNGLVVMPFMLLASYPLLKALLGNPLAPQARIGAMAQVCSVNIALGAFYAAAIAIDVVYVYGVFFGLPRAIWSPLFVLIQKCELSLALFVVVMFIGCLNRGGRAYHWLKPVRSELSIARACGLDVNRGVIVDQTMRTSDPHIYAAGDCAEFGGKVAGLWSAALAQGRTAGLAMAGAAAAYAPIVPATAMEDGAFKLFSAGTVGGGAHKRILLDDPASNVYKALYFDGDKLCGAVFLTDVSGAAAAMDAIEKAMARDMAMLLLL